MLPRIFVFYRTKPPKTENDKPTTRIIDGIHMLVFVIKYRDSFRLFLDSKIFTSFGRQKRESIRSRSEFLQRQAIGPKRYTHFVIATT